MNCPRCNDDWRYVQVADHDVVECPRCKGIFCIDGDIITPMDKKPMQESILMEADRIVNGERAEGYGDAATNFCNIATGWEVIIGHSVSGHQVALCMAWLKICREANSHKRDNLVDLAGYAHLADVVACES